MKKQFASSNHLFLLLILIGFLSESCSPSTSYDSDWPEITQTSKPWTRWWWQGSSVTREGITTELEAYAAAGIGGLELTPIYGVIGEEENFIDYLSSDWMDMLEFTIQEAERLGLGLDMATGTGWPFGGPWVGSEDACKYLAHRTFQLSGGEKLSEPVVYQEEPLLRYVPNPYVRADQGPLNIEELSDPISSNSDLQTLAVDQLRFVKPLPLQTLMAFSEDGAVEDLTTIVDQNGRLDWTAPEGTWTLYAVFEGLHGKMVERAAPGGEGNVIDHFAAASIQNYLSRFDSAFANRTAMPRAFFNDSYEVDDARGQANWTPLLFEAFEQKRGYDLRRQLPALFGQDTEENNIRVLSDFRETFSDLLLETFTEEWKKWAKGKGALIRNQAHGSPANILDLYAASDIPETEGIYLEKIKMASSAAHVAGKELASAEAATWLGEHFMSDLADLKENVDRYLVGGVNHVVYHGTAYSPPGEAWPGRLFYAAIHANPRNPLWTDWPTLNQYIARSQSILQAGQIDNDVLLYLPVYDRYATPSRELLAHFDGLLEEKSDVSDVADILQIKGYAYDFISDRQIQALSAENGALLSNGNTYQTIVVPECRFMPLPTLEKLQSLAENGASIVFHKSLPGDVPGLGNLDDRQAKFQAIKSSIDTDTEGIATVGAGRFLIGNELESLLNKAEVQRESMADDLLYYLRRKHEEGRYYFITKPLSTNFDGWITLSTEDKGAVFLDPMTGEEGMPQTRFSNNNQLEVRAQINRGGTLIIKTFRNKVNGEAWKYAEPNGDPVVLEGEWTIRFIKGKEPLPVEIKTNTLDDWTLLGDETHQYFSGTASYHLTFPKPDNQPDAWILDLGNVSETARVKLNGEELGVLIGPVYEMLIDGNLFQEQNELEVEVTNLMANRIIGLEKSGRQWKKFYNINFPARLPENRGSNGLFDASSWQPTSSGLTSMVRLIPVNVSQ